jgi:hypothetical protein
LNLFLSYAFPVHIGVPDSHRPHHKLLSPSSVETLIKDFAESGMTQAQIQQTAERMRNRCISTI